MKKTGILILVIAFISMSFTNPIKPIEKYNVDITGSIISWKGYKPTGSHNGSINLASGNLELEKGVIKGGSFTVDMATIKDADGSGRLEGHLKSADFFDVEAHTTSKFVITNSELKDGKTIVTGDITIKGITKQIMFSAMVTSTDETVTLTSETFQINRADFNIKYKSKTFFNNLKEKFVNDDFDLQVTIIATL